LGERYNGPIISGGIKRDEESLGGGGGREKGPSIKNGSYDQTREELGRYREKSLA